MNDSRPNILIVMADQMTAALSGAYGHPVVRTPALDRLCAEGVRFDAAYTCCPLCAPARAAMMTGRDCSRDRLYDNATPLSSDVPTFAHMLRAAGYEVVASGKMHFAGPDQLHGLERRLTTDIYPASFAWTPSWAECRARGIANEKGVTPSQARVRPWNRQLAYDSETQFRALEFLRERAAPRGDRRPFCLIASFTHPHPPYETTPEFWDFYEGAEIDPVRVIDPPADGLTAMDRWLLDYEGAPREHVADAALMRKFRRIYYGMVSYLDSLVGQLLGELDALGLRDSTAVFFLADHGDMLGERRLVEKRCFYEWSARAPLIARLPGEWPAARTCDAPVSLIDLCPTLTELAGAPPLPATDGRGFLELLQGRPDDGPERIAFSEYQGEGVIGPAFMARRGRHKYTLAHGHGAQLFDLAADPLELRNLAGSPAVAAVEADLRARILARFDGDAIAADVERSQADRRLIREAMKQGRPTAWDYQPRFDAGAGGNYVR